MIRDHIGDLLLNWAEWRARREDSGVGFPSQSAFVRMQPADGSPGAWSPALNEDAADVDACVCSLDSILFTVIMQHYTVNATLEQKMRVCQCGSERTFYRRLDDAKKRIMEFLQDMSAGVPLPYHGRVSSFEKKRLTPVTVKTHNSVNVL